MDMSLLLWIAAGLMTFVVGRWVWVIKRLHLTAFLGWHLPRLVWWAMWGSPDRYGHALADAHEEIDNALKSYVEVMQRHERILNPPPPIDPRLRLARDKLKQWREEDSAENRTQP